MKKVLAALVVVGITYFSANAQTTQKTCGASSGKVCRTSSNKKITSCYKTSYAENFKVCKGNYGYFICCEAPGYTNATHPQLPVAGLKPYDGVSSEYDNTYTGNYTANTPAANKDLIAPQSQSYPENTDLIIGSGGVHAKNYMRVCYGGDNVAENNRMPYHGCPSPQYDGPDKNNSRNINESNPINLPGVPGVKD